MPTFPSKNWRFFQLFHWEHLKSQVLWFLKNPTLKNLVPQSVWKSLLVGLIPPFGSTDHVSHYSAEVSCYLTDWEPVLPNGGINPTSKDFQTLCGTKFLWVGFFKNHKTSNESPKSLLFWRNSKKIGKSLNFCSKSGYFCPKKP